MASEAPNYSRIFRIDQALREEVPRATQFQEAIVPSGRRHYERRPMFSMPMGSMVATHELGLLHRDVHEIVTSSSEQAYHHFVEASPNIDTNARHVDDRANTSSSRNTSSAMSSRPERRQITGELVSSTSSVTEGYRALTDIYSVNPNVRLTGAINNENPPNNVESCEQDGDEEEKV